MPTIQHKINFEDFDQQENSNRYRDEILNMNIPEDHFIFQSQIKIIGKTLCDQKLYRI